MNKNIKIVISLSLSFAVSGFLLLGIDTYYHSNFDSFHNWATFMKQKQDEKKIFILGSSHVGMLDTNYIQQQISDFDTDYKVYNLAIAGDRPNRRSDQMNEIISLQPDLVVYGIRHKDFELESTLQLITTHKFQLSLMVIFFILSYISYTKPNLPQKISEVKLHYWVLFLVLIIFLILGFYPGDAEDFIYFQF